MEVRFPRGGWLGELCVSSAPEPFAELGRTSPFSEIQRALHFFFSKPLTARRSKAQGAWGNAPVTMLRPCCTLDKNESCARPDAHARRCAM